MATGQITGVFHGLTGKDLRPLQTTITKEFNKIDWDAAWVIYKAKHGNKTIEESSIPAVCSELSQYQLETFLKNTIQDAKHEIVKLVTEQVAPYAEEFIKGAKETGVAVMEVFDDATSAVKGGITKFGETGKEIVGSLTQRGQELGDAFYAIVKKKKVTVTLSSFEIFILAQMGIVKPDGSSAYRHISMGIMTNAQVYKVLYYIYTQNEPLLFMLHEMYKKTKQEVFQKKLRTYEEKKEAYLKSLAEHKVTVAQEALNVEREYNDARKKYEEDKTLYKERLDKYQKCLVDSYFKKKCEKLKPTVPISPVKRNTRKIVSPKKLSSATPVQKMSNFGVNSGLKKSEKVKALSAAIKQNSASASRRNRGSTRRRRS